MVATASYQTVVEQINSGDEPTALGDYIRDLLIETTLNSIAETQVPELVARAVVSGLWSSEYALRLADRITDEERKVRMYRALLSIGNLDEQQREYLERSAFDVISA